jgi:hypothetical protein
MRSLRVIASEAKQSILFFLCAEDGLPRRFAPRNDGDRSEHDVAFWRSSICHCARGRSSARADRRKAIKVSSAELGFDAHSK